MSNPASRLHAILVKSKDTSLHELPMLKGWRKVLALPDTTDDMLVMSKVGKVLALSAVITKCIERFSDCPRELYLGWHKDLASAFQRLHFDANFVQFGSRMSDSLLVRIEFCACELDRRLQEKGISAVDLEELRNSAWKLYEEVLGCNLTPHLQRYLLDCLYLIIEAIDDYDITGALGLERSLNTIIGTVVTIPEMAKDATKSDFGDRFWQVIAKVGAFLKVAKSATELAENARKLFLE